MTCSWYALRTKSRHENVVKDRLLSKEFDIFYPEVEAWSSRKDRKKKIFKALFPGYLFIKCILTKDIWVELLQTSGVVNLLGYGYEPTPIPDDQISSVQIVVNSGIVVKPHPYLNTGDKVLVKDGPLKGAIGVYRSYNFVRGNLVVSMDMLNRAIEVEIGNQFVEAF